ncbi:MAG: energy-coupling factor transporter ATPase [Eggerthellaceae bacterium]|jgi:energy-coupling factor transport system ATP-binding protein
MSLVFEDVSYSYKDLAHEGRKKRRERKLFRKRKLEEARTAQRQKQMEQPEEVYDDSPSSIKGEPAWGTKAGAIWALQNINFELADGEFFGIAGHTGSGKSTLIQHMNGLIQPTRGRVLFDGKDLAEKENASACRTQVGMIFQYPEHQLFASTVYDDIAFGPRNLGLDSEEVDSRVREAMQRCHLSFDEVAYQSPFELSGGQQRAVAFAGVLAMQPRTLVMDEPVAGLDPESRESFLALISELHTQGLTMVIVSHSMDDLARLCDRILVLNEGKQLLLGSPEEVFSHTDLLRDVGLDIPAAQEFAQNLRDDGFDIPEGLYSYQSLAQKIAKNFGILEEDGAQAGSVHTRKDDAADAEQDRHV